MLQIYKKIAERITHKWVFLTFLSLLLLIPTLVSAQNERKITIKQEKITVIQALKAVEKQSKMSINYSDSELMGKDFIDLDLQNVSLPAALDAILKDTGFIYQIQDNYIIITGKKTKTATQASKDIKGKVVDEDGEPLIGVNIAVDGSSTGTITDIDGNFSINVPTTSKIVVSYVGYATQLIPVSKTDFYQVIMKQDAEMLEEVVVTALGIKREQKALSYNVQQVKNDAFNTVKDANFMSSLAGKVAGVTINSSSTGAGGAARVVMRGSKSITKDNNALYVIDGIPMFNVSAGGSSDSRLATQGGTDAIADLNPDDIESINMLTGPSAAALYGNDAANGVVLINTKKGSAERTSLTVTNNTTFSNVYMMPEMQNTYGNLDGAFESWGNKTDKRYDPRNFYNTGTNVINTISFSTGTSKNQTYASASTTHSTGIIPNNSYSRYNFSIRNTATFLKDKLTLDIGAGYIVQNDKNMTSQGEYFNPIPALYLFPRNGNFDEIRMFERYNVGRDLMVQYWPYEAQGMSLQNPYWIAKRMNRESEKHRFMVNGSLSYKILDWLNVSGRVKLDNSNFRFTQERHATTLGTFAGQNGFYSDIDRTDRSIYADAMLTADKRFEDFTLNANLGASIKDLVHELKGMEGDLAGLANLFTIRNINYNSNFKPKQQGYHDQTQSIFANVELGWKSRLYLTLTGRTDWESMLAFTDTPCFFYPSVGVSAVLSEMFRLPEFISYAKVRGSYSHVGSSFARYLSNPGFAFNEQSHGWATSTTRPAANLKPEDTRSWEIGLNMKLWRNLSVDFTYYRSNTYHQTFSIDEPSSSGFSKGIVQTGNIQNQGIELALGYTYKKRDFEWNSSYTLTMNRSKVKRLAGGAINPATGEPIEMKELRVATLGAEGYGPRVILREGGSMSDLYVDKELKKDGNGRIWVDSQSGNLGVTTYKEPKKIGSMAPKANMGFHNNFSYKGFNLGVMLSARLGGLVISNTQGVLDYYGVSQATADARDAGGVWVNNGYVDAKKYYQTVGGANGGLGQYYTYSATNVRLSELNFSYTFPRKWFGNAVGITAGFVAKNLWMIYCKAPFDPELTPSTTSNFYQGVDYFMTPSTRNLGFNLKFQF